MATKIFFCLLPVRVLTVGTIRSVFQDDKSQNSWNHGFYYFFFVCWWTNLDPGSQKLADPLDLENWCKQAKRWIFNKSFHFQSFYQFFSFPSWKEETFIVHSSVADPDWIRNQYGSWIRIRNHNPDQDSQFGSGFAIRIRFCNPDQDSQSESGSRSRRTKMAHKNRKNIKFHILKCWMFFFQQCWGSVTFWCGSGTAPLINGFCSGSGSKSFLLQALFQFSQHLYEKRVESGSTLTNGSGSGGPKDTDPSASPVA